MNKLAKSKNRTLFGVCGGLAKYLNIDVSILRVIFILGTILSGSLVFWIYLLLALVLPNEE
ncbi:PspC domain-containing protein [bacterium]|nr:PspC domain-containing protein [bacterium]